MKLSYEDHQDITVLTISGELTVDQTDTFRRACQDRLAAGVKDFVLDFEHLTSVDSAGLEALLWLMDTCGEQTGRLRIVNPDETIATILSITRLDRKFQIDESVEAAGKSLR